jgi:hypothetical protein
MKAYLKCEDTSMDPFDEIAINPAYISEGASSGLCGTFLTSEQSTNDEDCNFHDQNGDCVKYGNIQKIVDKWRYIIY